MDSIHELIILDALLFFTGWVFCIPRHQYSLQLGYSDIRNRLGDLIFDPNHNFEVIIDIITEIIQNWSAIYPV